MTPTTGQTPPGWVLGVPPSRINSSPVKKTQKTFSILGSQLILRMETTQQIAIFGEDQEPCSSTIKAYVSGNRKSRAFQEQKRSILKETSGAGGGKFRSGGIPTFGVKGALCSKSMGRGADRLSEKLRRASMSRSSRFERLE